MKNIDGLRHFILLIILGLCFCIIKPITYNWNGEDCYITYRVAENFAEGHGFVFNKGQFVEAHSNFLWTAILGFFYKVGLDTQNTSKILSVSCVVATIFLLGFMRPLRPKCQQRSIFELTAPVLYLFHPIVHYQCDVALETSLYVFLIVLGAYFLIRFKPVITSSIFASVAMTRPEGFGFFIVVLGIFFYLFIRDTKKEVWNNKKKRIAFCVKLIIPFLLLFGILEAWRLLTYGYLFPNTVYAKTSSWNFWYNSSLNEIRTFIISCNFLPLLILLTLKNKKNEYIFILFCFILATLTYIILIGSVFATCFQHYITMTPFIALLLQEIVITTRNKMGKITLAILFVCFTFYTPSNKDIESSRPHVRFSKFLVKLDYIEKLKNFFRDPEQISSLSGTWLKNNFPENTRVVSGQMGQLGYFSDFYMIDVLGLADSHVAHAKTYPAFTLDYALSQKPDIWVIVCYNNGSPAIESLSEIISSREFRNRFSLRYILQDKYQHYQYQVYTVDTDNKKETLILS